KGVEITLDLVGGPYVAADIRVAALKGRIMLIGTIAGRSATIPVGMVLGKRLTVRGTGLRARTVEEKRSVAAAVARDVVPLLAAGAGRPGGGKGVGVGEIRAAPARLAGNETFGEIVLKI